MNKKPSNPGLRWFQTKEEARNMGRVYYVFNPEHYSVETLTQTNALIKYCLGQWALYGIVSDSQRQSVETMERQYYNNQRRIFHYRRFYSKKMNDLCGQFSRLSLQVV